MSVQRGISDQGNKRDLQMRLEELDKKGTKTKQTKKKIESDSLKSENDNSTNFMKESIENEQDWNYNTPIETFFLKILPPLGFDSEQIKQKIAKAKEELEVMNVYALNKMTEQDLKPLGLSVVREIQQQLKKSKEESETPRALKLEKDIEEIKDSLKKLTVSNASVSFSKISIPGWEKDFLSLRLHRRDVRPKFDVENLDFIKGYSWTEAAEDKQMDPCLKWLYQCIPLPEYLRYTDVHTQTKRYTVQIGEHTYKGGTYIIINPTWASEDFQAAIAVIELKKQKAILDDKVQFIAQVEAELIAASNVSSFPVLAVLTDLNDYWLFTWFIEDGHIARCTCTCARDGVAFLSQFIRKAELPDPEDMSQKPPQKFVFPTCVAYKFPPSFSKSPDVANELDLLDMVSPADQMEILSRYALQHLSYYS